MAEAIRLISTDFDGTLFDETACPQIPVEFADLITDLRAEGIRWVINTGRDLPSLRSVYGTSGCRTTPDFVVSVEREIHIWDADGLRPAERWNRQCAEAHRQLFREVRPLLPAVLRWIRDRYAAQVFEDVYSPFCLVAGSNEEADLILDHVAQAFAHVSELAVMRNDIYARFCHSGYTKGTALAEISRQLGLGAPQVVAAGDHWNDLPMLDLSVAQHLIAPHNAIEPVKQAVRRQGGYVSQEPCGRGLLAGLRHHLGRNGVCARTP